MHRVIFGSLGLLFACATAPTVPTAEPATRPAKVQAPTVEAVPDHADASPDVACSYTSMPATDPGELNPPAADAACRTTPGRVARRLRAQVRERWHRQWEKGTLTINPGCDRLDPQLETIVYHGSSGHGGSLTLAQFDRETTGAYTLTLLEYNHYYGTGKRDPDDPWQQDSIGKLEGFRAPIDAADMKSVLEQVRAALFVEVDERPPPPRPDGLGLGGISMSSRDFHATLRLIGSDGRGVERHFAGYEGSGDGQRDSVSLDLASRPLRELLYDDTRRAAFAPLDLDGPDARALFSRSFWQAHARGEDFGYWYIGERFLGMTARLGAAEHVPVLLDQLGRKGDTSVARMKILSVNALASLVQYDVRYDDQGVPRAPNVVIDETLSACGQ